MQELIEGYRLSPQQEQLWQWQTDASDFRLQCAVSIKGAVRLELLAEAWKQVLRRHEILRTAFRGLAGMDLPLQVIVDDVQSAFDVKDVSGDLQGELEEQWDTPFDLEHGQVIHARVLRRSSDEHVMILTLSALCGDERSLQNLAAELMHCYSGRCLEDDAVQYVQFSEWQRELLDSEEASEAAAYWRSVRDAGTEPVRLPQELKQDEALQRATIERVEVKTSSAQKRKLESVARACDVNLSQVLLGGWASLLMRISGHNEVRIECAFDGRKFEEMRGGIGTYTKWLPVLVQYDARTTFRHELLRIKQSQHSAWMWQEYYAADQERGIGFEYLETGRGSEAAGVRFKLGAVRSWTAPLKLKLSCVDEGATLRLQVSYDTNSYNASGVERLLGSLTTLLESLSESGSERVGRLPVLSTREQQQVVKGWNETRGPVSELSVAAQFEAQVARTPAAVALVSDTETVTFAELNERANQVAHYLRGLGVGAETLVGLCLERSVAQLVGLLGIMKAGGAYVPLEPGNPAARLQYELQDAGVRVLLTDEATAQRGLWSELDLTVVLVDEISGPQGVENLESEIAGENLAYVIYTSGTTGKPKGTLITQRGVWNLRAALAERVYAGWAELGPLRVGLNAPLGFDGSVKQWLQLLNGHTLVLIPEAVRADGEQLCRYLREQQVAVLDSTPGQLEVLLAAGLEQVESLVGVLVGGEAIGRELWQRLSDSERIRYFNLYGPTECTVDATVAAIDEVGGSAAVLGRPLQNVRVYVLDREQQAVGVGVKGELYIGGAGVGRGYLGQAALTSEKYVPDGQSGLAGERLYRTGDEVRWNERGELEYVGRLDGQVKLRGNRIELGEIEQELESHAGVAAAVVQVQADGVGGEPQLVAYVQAARGWEREGSREEEKVIDGEYRLPNDLAVVQMNRNETAYLYHEIFEKGSYVRHGVQLPAGACVFDVGANIGLFTLYVSGACAGARIYAFEPIAEICERLRENARRHGRGQVKVFGYGLGAREERRQFSYYPRYTMMSGVQEYADAAGEVAVIKRYLANEQEQGASEAGELLAQAEELLAGRFEEQQRECLVRRLGAVVKEEGVERIDLLKIDVQRAEEEVLAGIEEEYWERIGQVVMEVHDEEGSASAGRVERLAAQLRERGYEVTVEQDELLQGTDRYNLYGVRAGWVNQIAATPIEKRVVGTAELRRYLEQRLPSYMVPGRVVWVAEMPLTRHGKVDRRQLALLGEAAAAGEVEEYEAAQGAVEELVAGIFAAVLQREQVSRRGNFFALGGHSLLATQVMSRVRSVFGVEVPLRSLFEHPTVQELSAELESALRGERVEQAPPLVRVSRERELPLSFAQQRLWFLDQLEPGSAFYNSSKSVRLRGRLDQEALERTLSEIVRRHEVLRTTFRSIDGEAVQVIGEAQPQNIPLTELSELEQARELIHAEAQTPFDLSIGPLLRVHLLRLGAEEHIVVLTMHHIVSDAWSMGLLLNEVSTLYRAYTAGEASPLMELPIQYADYAVWQREWLQGEVLEAELGYWREQLGGEWQVLELPTDRVRPAVQSYRGRQLAFRLSKDLSESLHELSRTHGCTLFMTLLAAFQTLLYRYSGQEDIVVGSPIAGRNRVEIEKLIGFFVNTLVLRTDLRGGPTFVQLLKRVREVALGAYAHQEVPFEKLVEELQPERDLSRSPLFQVMFTLQNVDTQAAAAPVPEMNREAGLMLNLLEGQNENAKFDLSLSVVEDGAGIACAVEYSTDLFDEVTIKRLVQHFQQLLSAVADDPRQQIGLLPLLSATEREQLLVEWNDTAVEQPRELCIQELFERQAALTPDAVAVVFGNEQLTYAELNLRANHLGHELRSLGVGAETLVGLCVERSPELLVGLLGILKAGGAYVPLDPNYPAERLEYMLADAGLSVVVTQRQFATLMLESQCVVWIDDYAQTALAGENPALVTEPANLAYVLYTSGSSGRPKGVAITHAALVNHAQSMATHYELKATDRVLQFASLSFDVALEELFPTWASGGCVVMRTGQELTAAEFWTLVREHEISVVNLVTWYWQEVMEELARREEALPSSLRLMVIGSERGRGAQLAVWSRLLPDGVRLMHGYGPTEATVTATVSEVGNREWDSAESLPIGRGIGNVEVYVLGAGGAVQPVGVVGELYVGGVGIGRGYLGRTAETAEKFVPDSYSGRAGARLYRTGDLAKWRADGELEFIGRVDEQVKVRGYRIELGEIEAALLGHGGVREAVVVAREERLVGYVVLEADELSTSGLREYLSERLPSYMVPGVLVQLTELPLTPNGKVDRKALALREDVGERAEESVLPRTAVEELLASIWAGVLRVEAVGVEENFFALGGHSLLATQVMSRVREVFGVEVPLRSLFEQPTVAGLGGKIEQALRGERGVTAPPLERVSRERELPLSFAQQRLWFLDQLEPGSAFYNVPTAVRLQGELNIEALEQTLTEIVWRHEVLRTVFQSVNGEAVQVIREAQRLEIPVTELSAWEEARELIDAEAQTPFDLSIGPLLRVRVLRLAAEEHVVLLTMHHIVSDGWSMGLLLNEIATLYRSFTRGEEPELPELPIQYADYAVWQREWLQGEVLEAELAYWREQLDGELSGLALPTDRVRPAVQSYRGAQLAFRLSRDLSQSLQQLSRHHGCTLFMTLLAVFQTLLYRYSGQEEIAVGSPIAGRNRVEIEKLIGFFVNTLVLRTDLSGGPTFVELLKRVREVALGAYAHQEVPFEKLVEELQPERDLSRSPLFQVMFTLQNMDTKTAAPDAETNREAGFMLKSVGGKSETAKFDLSLSVVADGAGIAGAVEYSTDLFDEVTIKRLVEHFQQLLSAVADEPRTQIGLLPLLSPAEQEQLLIEWNDTALEYPRGLCMHQLFEAQVERQPEAMALRCGAERLSYRELNERANRVAQYLVQAGVQAEDRVGILMERSAAMIVALLGVLKAGGCYVPLDPQYPRERLEFMQADAGLRVLLTTGGMAAQCGLAERALVQWVCVDEVEQRAAQCDNPEVTISEQQLAYLIYTSGSTGVPKGVAITHGNASSFIHWAQTVFAPEQLRGVLCATSICFDLSIFEIFVTLSSGGELLLVDNVLQLAALPAASAAAVTLVNTVPSAMTELLRLGAVPPSVAVVNLAGEALPAELVAAIYAQTEVQQVYNLYGPSEATTYSTYTGLAAGERVTIGRPVANTRAYVLDKQLQLAPVGVAGELYLGGAGVARGYWQRAELTGAQFVPDHVSGVAGARLYRTGDLVKWRADGELEFMGRADQQVKVRGYRIELGEVENALRQQEQVREAVVLVRGTGHEQRLVGYVVAAEGGRLNVTELRAALQRQLPEYMTPGAFVQLAELPLTPNGKVNRKALALREDVGERAEESVLPRTAVEELLASIWAGVLRVEGVGVEENFFALGGHSLLATQVMSRVREVFGIELPLRSLFEQPTVAALAGKIEQALRGERGVAAPPLEKVSRERELPLSFAQQRLWFLDQLEPGSAFYNVPTAVRLQGELNVEALEQTLTEIVRRHEVLRTVFQSVNGEAVQVIREAQRLEIPVTELSAWEEARELINAEAHTPFDLSTGPLLRVSVIRVGAEEHIVLLTMHHIVSDGWSMGLLLNEVATLYRAYSTGEESPVPELPIQYADYAVWQREWLQGEVLEAELAYWRQQLGGELSGLALPTDRVRPAVQSYRGAQLAFHLSRDLSQSLHELSRTHGCTLFMTLLAAFQTLLYRYSGQEEIAVGSPIAGRNRVEIEKLIGFFVNTLVLRTDLRGGPTFVELLKRVREVALGAYAHQEVPFEKLVEELQPERDLSRSPLFQVMFTLQNAAATTTGHAEGTTPHLHLSSLGGEHESAKFDLSLFLSEISAGLAGSIEYSTDLFDAATIRRMMRHFESLLHGVVENPQQEIGLLPLLSDEERQQLLLEWNETATHSPRESCMHELFEAQVQRTPENVAVVFEDQQLTYTELNTRANQLAHHLQSLGVRAETLVGLCVERSLEMVVGLLGILKAGGAYVPLDPEHPAERLRFTLEDAGINLVLTQELLQNKLTLLTRIVSLDGEWNEIAQHDQGNPTCNVAADNLAYVSYTSGSTGRPKGVSIPHRAVVSLLCPSEFVRLDERETVLQMAPLPFDASTFEVWGSLLNGARLVVMPAGQPTLEEIGAVLRSQRVTTLWLTAGLFHLMVDEQLDALAQVRQMLAGGDVLSVEHSRKYLAAAGADGVLVNGYGPTESTTFTTCEVLRDALELQTATSVAIGKVVGGRRAYVVDEHGELVGQRIWGELYIGGAGVGRGYVQRAAETAERFVPDCWSGEWGGRLYRTGDVVRWKGDGKLEFKGRADGQVKLRGYRIEVGEIEAVLLDHGDVREAVVVVREDDGEKRLVGYVVAEAEESELREYLAQRLPSYMVPATLLKLDQLPLTPNGKIDRRALPAPDGFIRAAYVAPRSESERILVEIWSQVLNRQNIGIYDNFFELGGHSLLATRIISQVIKRFQVQVPLRNLFESPTIAALSEAIEKARENQSSAPQPLSIKRVSREAHRVNAATLKSH